jgi:tetratricopeptide (TPR) repeat protein
VLIPTAEPLPKAVAVVLEEESCLPWDLRDLRPGTVSATRLSVSPKARSQYEKACGALKKKKLTEAEHHVRDAIQTYSDYPAAWVMLGQILQDEQKMTEARDACSQALSIDPTYLPPYLCLAGLLYREKQWGDLLTWAKQPAISSVMNPAVDMYVFFYRGVALFNLDNLPEAQESISEAIAIDREHHHPGFYLVLAQIYVKQGNVADATLQIRQFLKFSNSRKDKAAASQALAELQSQPNTK